MPTHEPDWYETGRSGNEITFKCRVCGRTIKGNAKMYDEGRWFPSMGNHS